MPSIFRKKASHVLWFNIGWARRAIVTQPCWRDALSAVNTIRSLADAFGINPYKLGVIGSSSGGHLAAHTLLAWKQYDGEVSLRPDFGVRVLCGVIFNLFVSGGTN